MTNLVAARPAARTPPSASPQIHAALPWLLASLSMTMVALTGQQDALTFAIFAGCALWRLWLERTGGPLPSLYMRIPIFLLALGKAWSTAGLHLSAGAMLSFLIALISLKILELRSARDLTVLALLGYFIILSAFFYDQSLALNLYLSVAALTNTVALIRCHADGGNGWGGLRLALGLSLQAFPLTVLLFVIFPRLEASFVHHLGADNQGRTGMSDHLEPGSFSSLVESDLPAFHAQLKTPSGVLPARSLYWRGLVLNVCENAMIWRVGGAPQDLAPGAANPPGAIEQQITLSAHARNWLFALDYPVGITPSKALHPAINSLGVAHSSGPILNKVTYTVVSQLTPDAPNANAKPPPGYDQPPREITSRTRELVDRWRRAAHSDEDIVQAAKQYFRTGGFRYTLKPGPLPAGRELDYFLFEGRRGFCEHYAAAFATLMRVAQVPSRVVLGYQGGEFNTWWGSYYSVRQSDAHAWAEVWLKGKGWQREDPTAVVAPERVSLGAESFAELSAEGRLDGESRLDQLSTLGGRGSWRWVVRNVAYMWDGIDQQWNLFVLGYNEDQQAGVMERLSAFLQRVGLGGLGWVSGVILTLGGVFGIMGLGALGMLALDRTYVREEPAQRLYARFCRRAARAGVPVRGEAEGPLDFAQRASQILPNFAAQIDSVTISYVAVRYSSAGGAALGSLRAAVTAFRPRRVAAA